MLLILLFWQILQGATFCLIIRGARLAQPILLEAMAAGCVPVIVADSLVMPFQEVLDWKRYNIFCLFNTFLENLSLMYHLNKILSNLIFRVAVFVAEEELSGLLDTIRRISDDHLLEMQKNGQYLYQSYFSSIKTITNTALDILNQRVFPQSSKTYEEWNVAPNPVGISLTQSNTDFFLTVLLL